MRRIHFSVGPTVQISLVHRLRRPFHTWPVPPRWAVGLLYVALIFTATASAQIAPNGDVWTCCIRAESMGNLRESGFDFMKVWTSKRAGRSAKPTPDKPPRAGRSRYPRQ